jgi:hypothetical protein
MAHYDPTTLALLALGESGVTDDDGVHLTGCRDCRREVAELADVAATGRATTQDDLPEPAPDVVWQRILSDIAPATDNHADAEAVPVEERRAVVTSIRSRRRSAALLAAAAALVGLLVGVGATYAATRTPSPPPVAGSQIVLQPLDALAAHGTAALDESAGGQRTLTVTVTGLPTVPGTFYEVWLMNATPQRLLSLGVLDAGHGGVFQIPAGLDLSRYPVVDISLQPFNGSPAHSGNSAVRGTLPA